MQQLQVAPKAAQQTPQGRSGYSWCISRCEVLLSTVLSSPTLVVMLLSLLHLEKKPWANTPQHTCDVLLFLLCYFYWSIHCLLPALAKPQTAFGQWIHQGPEWLKPSWWKAHLHVHLFRKTEENDSKFPSWRKRGVGIIKSNMLLHASRFTCPQPCTAVGLWSGSQTQPAAFT